MPTSTRILPVPAKSHRNRKKRRADRKRARQLFVESLEDRRMLATLTVNSELDNLIGGDGLVTLREAIIAANGDTATDLGDTGSGADEIVFDPSLDGTPIVLSLTGGGAAAGDLNVTSPVTIQGNGANETTITAGGYSGIYDRVLAVDFGSLTVNDVTITGGYKASGKGGGIFVSSGASASVSRSTLTGNFGFNSGGGIYNAGTLSVVDSSVSGNSADYYGAGIFNYGSATITNSTISGNTCNSGAGFYTKPGSTTDIVNSTISGNTAGNRGGAIWNYGSVTLTQSTVTGNSASYGGGLYVGATLNNSIVVGNTATMTGADVFGTFVSNGANIIGDITGASGFTGTDQTGLSASAVVETSLAANGGPTQTHALVTSSPAIDAGKNADAVDPDSNPLTTDQRGAGFDRIVNGTVDIGAFEFVPPPPDSFVVDIATDEADGDLSPGDVSLRDAIIAANANPNQSTITFDPSLDGTPIVLTLTGSGEDAAAIGDLDVSTEVIIQGNGQTNTVIDAGGAGGLEDRVLHVVTGGDLTISNSTITGGTIDDNGGGIYLNEYASLTVMDSTVSGNNADGAGGGIYGDDNTSLSVVNSTITGNTSDNSGGGIYVGDGSTLTVTDSAVTGNAAGHNHGGGIYAEDETTVVVTGSTVTNNTAASRGGGIFIGDDSTLTISNTTLSDNSAGQEGGGLYMDDSVATIASSTISGNMTPGDDGGGIANFGTMSITDSTVFGNTSEKGGAIYNDGTLTITDSAISGNTATELGGGIYSTSTMEILDSTIRDNSAGEKGGGLYNGDDATVTNSTISGNSAVESGGGIYTDGTLNLVNSTVSGNSAATLSAGIHNDSIAVLNVVNSTIAFNTGASGVNSEGTTTINNSIVAGNPVGDLEITGAGTFSGSNNLVQDGSDAGTGLVGTINADPLLDPLQNNGGPTETHALGTGSPAIDAGDNALAVDEMSNPLTTDQRGAGFTRIENAIADIGAFEATPPDSFVVDIATDEADGDLSPGDVSLRDAIIAANADPNPTTITFAPGLDGVPIALTLTGEEDMAATGDLDITTEVTIMGNGTANTIIDAGGVSGIGERVLHVLSGDLTVDGLSITGGQALGSLGRGGGVRVETTGSLTLMDSTVSGSYAFYGGGGVSNAGTAAIRNSTISSNSAYYYGGGGVANDGALTITGSTISANSVQYYDGGGVANSGSLTVTSSTISGNRTDRHGAGLYNNGSLAIASSTVADNYSGDGGGGIYTKQDLRVVSSTISGNVSRNGGGIMTEHFASVTLSIVNSTLSGNRGRNSSAIAGYSADVVIESSTVAGNFGRGETVHVSDGSLSVENTVFAANVARAGTDVTLENSTATGSNNLSDGSVPGTIAAPTGIDPVLRDNGGPTKTHAVLAGSNAIDTGDAGLLPADSEDLDGDMNIAENIPFDQRDMPRILGGGLDIGAFEAGNVALTISDSMDPTEIGETFDVTVTVSPIAAGTPTGTVTLTDDFGDFAPIVMAVPASGIITFAGLSLSTSNSHTLTAAYSGDGTFDAVQITEMHDHLLTVVVNTAADEDDGTPDPGMGTGTSLREAISFANTGDAVVKITFDASLDGSPIQLNIQGDDEDNNATGDLDVLNTMFIEGNGPSSTIIDAGGQGGLDDRIIDAHRVERLDITGVTLRNAFAESTDGAGIMNRHGNVNVADTVITGNTGSEGSGIHNLIGTLDVRNSSISGNTATSSGAGINNDAGAVSIADSRINDNRGTSSGIGIYHFGTTLTVRNSIISGNENPGTSTPEGGGVFVDIQTTFYMIDSTVSDNHSNGRGGGLALKSNSNSVIINSTISGNSALASVAGGIYHEGASLSLINSTISNNTAEEDGGGIHARKPMTIINSTITGNTSLEELGGGIYTRGSDQALLQNTIVAGNTANGSSSDFEGSLDLDPASANNVIGDPNTAGGLMDTVGGNIVGDGGMIIDTNAILDVLADNGGATLTHGLLPGSPALDNGDNSLLPADQFDLDGNGNTTEPIPLAQNGAPRVVNGTVDIGSHEGVATLQLVPVAPSPRTEFVSTVDVIFFVNINPATYTTDDISLTLDGSPVSTASLMITDQGGGMFEISGLAALTASDGEYELTVDATGIDDIGGTPLPGSRTITWTTDSLFPAKIPVDPRGSLIYDPVVSRSLPSASDVQNLKLDVDAGQTITVIVKPDSALQPVVDLLGPSGMSVAAQTAATAGATTIVQTAAADADGTYTISISPSAGTTGDFTVQVFLNAAVELEQHGGPANDTTGTAEDINSSFISLGLLDVTRGAVLGNVQGGFFYTGQKDDSLLRAIDSTGATLSSIDIGSRSRSLAIDPTTSNLYALLDSGDLATVDPASGSTTVIGSVDVSGRKFGEIEFDGSGNLYGVTGGSFNSADHSSMFSIDKANPATQSLIHTFGTEGAGGLAFNPDDGLFYRFMRGTFESIEVSTPTVTNISLSGDFPTSVVQSMTYLGSGQFMLGSPNELYTVDTSGASGLSGSISYNAHGLVQVEAEETVDVFSFDLSDGDVVSLVLDGDVTLELLDTGGGPLATATGGHSNVDAAIEDVTVSGAGTYFARVASASIADYAVVITRNAAFDLELNDDLPSAQPLGASAGVLGFVSGAESLLGADNGDTNLLSIDTATGAATIIASGIGDNNGYIELARNPVSGMIYASQGNNNDDLYVVDPNTGMETLVSEPGTRFFGLAWSPDGMTLYATNRNDFGTIDPVAGTFADIAPVDERVGGLAFQPGTGTLFGVLNRTSGLITIDPISGVQTPVGDPGIEFNSLTFLSDGTLLAGGTSGDGALYQLDPTTGMATFIGQTVAGGNLTGLAPLPVTNDYFSFDVTSGETIDFFTQTPAGGPNEFVNLLDPEIELFDPTGASVATDDNSHPDGRNALVSHMAAMTGTYVVRVGADGDTRGEYALLRGTPVELDTEVTLATGVLTITDINGGDSNDDLTLSYSGGTYTLSDGGALTIEVSSIVGSTGSGTNAVTFPDTGITSIVFDTLGGDDSITVDGLQASLTSGFTVNDGAGDDEFILNGSINTGAGDVSITVSRSIALNPGSSITATSGNITLNANQQVTPTTTGNFAGIDVNNATVESTGSGNIELNGTGGESLEDFLTGSGVMVRAGGGVISSGTGSLTINGNGGPTGARNYGVRLSDAGTTVMSAAGLITINGQAGGTTFDNPGIRLEKSALVQGAGNAAIDIKGTASGTKGVGVAVFLGGMIQAEDGTTTIDGTAAGAVTGGVLVFRNSSVESTTGTITINGTGADTTPGVAVETAFGGAGTVRSNSGDITLTGTANGTGNGVQVRGGGSSVEAMGGAILIESPRNVVVDDSASVSNTNGDITLNSNQQMPATTGNFAGIEINNATVTSTGSGSISINGTGGESSGNKIDGSGVSIHSGGDVVSSGTGSLTLNGNGGPTADQNYGVRITDVGTTVTSTVGTLTINGQAGGTTIDNPGIRLENSALVQATGNAAIDIDGTGSGTKGVGVAVFLGGRIEAANGAIAIDGVSAGDVRGGVLVFRDGTVESTAGTIDITGTGSGTTPGVSIETFGGLAGNVRSANGNVSIIGTATGMGDGVAIAGAGSTVESMGGKVLLTSARSVVVASSAAVTNTAGDIVVTANAVDISTAAPLQGSGALVIRPDEPTTTIGLGGGVGTLNLDDTELSLLQDGFSSITIGDTVAGVGTADIDTAAFADPVTIAGGTINDAAGTDIDAGTNSVTLQTSVSPGQSPGVLMVTGNFGFGAGSTFEAELMGTTPGTDQDQITVTGTVDINNATLNIDASGFTAVGDEQFVLIDNDGVDAVTGTFSGLPEGTLVTVGDQVFQMMYAGGDGNDVVLGRACSFEVTTTTDIGFGTLRRAIECANDDVGTDAITFNIPGAGPHTIQPASALPTITDPVIIDGTSQPGFASTPLIELDGSNAGPGASGLRIDGGNSTVRGLAINRFSSHGILLAIGGGNTIRQNMIGSDPSGSVDLGNALHGLVLFESPNNVIGGTGPNDGNVISGNDLHGINIAKLGATGNMVQGNLIGVAADGVTPLGNGRTGIRISLGANNNTIGGTAVGAGNVIAHQTLDGIAVVDVRRQGTRFDRTPCSQMVAWESISATMASHPMTSRLEMRTVT